MAVLGAKGKKTPAGKAKAASTSSSSKASSIGSLVSGNGGVGSTYSNTGNTVADKAVRESTGQSAQSSANDIQAAKTAGTHVSQTTDRLSTTAQPNTQPQPTAQDKATVDWNNMTLAQQKLYAKLNPQVDLAAKGWEFAKSNAQKIAAQNGATSGKNDAWLGQKPQAQQQEAPQVPDYQDNSAERMAEISANLEAAYQQTPNLFKNRELYDAEFEYDKRSKSQKRALDEFFNRKTQEAVLKSISANDIVNSIASGKTSIEKYGVLETIDPVKYQAVLDGIQVANNRKKADSNLAVNNATLQSADGKSTELTVPKELTENNAAIEAAINSNADEYKAAVNDPDLMAKRDELTEEMGYVDQLDKDIMRVKDEVAAQYPGVPRSQLNAIIADRTDKYRIERGDALIKINTLQGIINNRLEEAQLNYNVENNRTSQLMSLESQKLQQLGFAFQLKSYEEAPQRAKELAQFQSDLQLQQNQAKMEQEFDFANPDWNSTDPAEQNRALTMAVNSAYETFGDIIQRSPAQVIADVKKYAQENGVSMQEALQQNFISQLKDKPEYQQILNAKVGVSNDPNEGIDWGIIDYDAKTGKPIMGWIDKNTRSTSGSPSRSSNVTPSGNYVPIVQGGKTTNKKLDEVAAAPLNAALAEMEAAGITTILGSATRTHEEQAALHKAYQEGTGGVAAAPGQSLHESGLGMDLYSGKGKDGKLLAPTQKQIEILAKHGREWQNIPGDAGHFEYIGAGVTKLSPLAQTALDSKTAVGTPTQKAAQIEELQENGYLDKGEGNANFYLADAPTKTELGTLLAGYEKWSTAYDIFAKGNTDKYSGWFDNMLRSGDEKLAGGGNKDAIKLNNILSKELSTYMQRISGATVPKEEVNRLRDQIPNLNMGDKQFKTNMETYNTDMVAAFNRAMNTYGFDSIESMRATLGSTPADIDTDIDPIRGQLQVEYPAIQAGGNTLDISTFPG